MKHTVGRHFVRQPKDKSIKLVPLTQGKNALVDAADYEYLMQWNWYTVWSPSARSFYAMRYVDGKVQMPMSNQVLRLRRSVMVDHVSRNTLDNRQSNLRRATRSQNGMNREKQNDNTSGYKGVYRNASGYWYVKVSRNYFGTFDTPEEAAIVYNEAAKQIHGKFARLNQL